MAEREVKRRTCFVMMPFSGYEELKSEVIEPAIAACNLEMVVADHTFTGPVLEWIERELSRAAVCIAEISDKNPNVMYEVGLARVMRKEVILLTKQPDEAPFDVSHMQMIAYQGGSTGLADHRSKLRAALESTVPFRLVGRMLVPTGVRESLSPFVIAACPLSWRVGRGRPGGFSTLISTSSDNYGIRSLIHEFGYIYGTERLPELVDPEDHVDEVVRQPMHMYCIGSPKSNRWTGAVLEAFNKTRAPKFWFVADGRRLRDVEVRLQRDGNPYAPVESSWMQDFGLIIRGPNPFAPGHMAMILAGCRSTGTEAACRAATDARLLKQIQDRGCNLDDFQQPFFAVVLMERFGKEQNYRPNEQTMQVLEAAPCS